MRDRDRSRTAQALNERSPGFRYLVHTSLAAQLQYGLHDLVDTCRPTRIPTGL